jgi:hypothetical protein
MLFAFADALFSYAVYEVHPKKTPQRELINSNISAPTREISWLPLTGNNMPFSPSHFAKGDV